MKRTTLCASALSRLCRRRVRYLNGVVSFSFFFFFIYSAFAECDGLGKTIYWLEIEKRIQFRRVSIYILSDSYSSKIDCASVLLYIYIYFYSRAEISNTADKRSRFSSSYTFYRSWVRRYARKSDSGRLTARSRSVICVTSLRFNDESWLFIDLFARIQKGRASEPLSRVSDVGTHPGEIRWGRVR